MVMDRDTLRALDAVGPAKNQATLDHALGMGGGRDKKRRLDALEAKVSEAPPGGLFQRKHQGGCKVQGGTRGLILANMRAVVCLDYVGDHCYVDIQGWQPSRKRTGELAPSDLHERLGKWGPYWATGGGRMSHSAAARFRTEVLGLEQDRTSAGTEVMMRDVFGPDDTTADSSL